MKYMDTRDVLRVAMLNKRGRDAVCDKLYYKMPTEQEFFES